MSDNEDVELIISMGEMMADMAVAMSLAHDAKPSTMLAALVLAVGKLNVEYAKTGHEADSLEQLISGIRAVHLDVLENRERRAVAESAEGAQAGRNSVKGDGMKEFSNEDAGLVKHMTDAIIDFAEFMAMKNRADPRFVVAAVSLAVVGLVYCHCKAGTEKQAIEPAIDGIRVMYADLLAEHDKEAVAEAMEAKARGSVQ
jgi:hypothetical protein